MNMRNFLWTGNYFNNRLDNTVNIDNIFSKIISFHQKNKKMAFMKINNVDIT